MRGREREAWGDIKRDGGEKRGHETVGREAEREIETEGERKREGEGERERERGRERK